MKKIYISLTILAAAIASVSCQKESGRTGRSENGLTVINAVAEAVDGASSKVEMAPRYIVLWQDKDEILVRNDSKTAIFTLAGGEGTTTGTFSCAKSPFGVGDAVEAYSPASLSDGEKLVWPYNQSANLQVPMYCARRITAAADEYFKFSSLGGIIQFVFATTQSNGTLLEVGVRDGRKPLSGAFTIVDGKAVISPAVYPSGIVLDLGSGVAMGKSGKYFSVAVPEGKYENLMVDFVFSGGYICTASGIAVNVECNSVNRIYISDVEPHLAPESVSLDITDLRIESTDKTAHKLVPTVLPEGAPNKAVTWVSSNTGVATVDDEGNVRAVADGTAVITVTTVERGVTATCTVTVSASALTGAFSVSDSRKVRFSGGNLRATYKGGTTYDWSIAPHQYDFIGKNNTIHNTPNSGDMVDLFGWSTYASENNWGIKSTETSTFFDGQFLDWGRNIGGSWRTLTSAEWEYLFGTSARRNGKYAYGVTVVEHENCIILYPDTYDGSIVSNGDTSSYDTEEKWAEAENKGAVCLPAAGYRTKDKVYVVDKEGRYWSSTPTADNLALVMTEEEGKETPANQDEILYSKAFQFKATGITGTTGIVDGTRYVGRSVRLVTDVQ